MRSLVTAACALVALSAAPAAHATFPGGNGRVALGVEGSDFRHLQTVKPDSRGDRFLRECVQPEGEEKMGDCAIEYRSPAWHPNGRRLIFDTGRSLALIGDRGRGYRKLPAFSADDSEPAFSPSGAQIVFSGRAATRSAIFTAPVSGGRERRIASDASSPDWSRRGQIAFVRGGAIFSVRPSGRGAERLTSGRDPSWSPSGRQLAFARSDGIYVADDDGSQPRRVVRCRRCSEPAFSPDGKLLAYDARGIQVARVSDGRRQATLVEDVSGSSDAFDPAWQPL